ncbi:MAG: hypothetical protein QOJ51_3449 [Acidobacteriaceae bacterium]|nr:hypothetical protein [Acidobacteriaceae bacterium]
MTYCGVPAQKIYRHRQGHDPSHGVPLDSRHDLANLGSIAENRDDSDGSRCQLALAILADFLGDTRRALRVYRAFARSIVTQTPVGRLWLMTESDVADALATAESNSGLVWDKKRGPYMERASPVAQPQQNPRSSDPANLSHKEMRRLHWRYTHE